jgi:putative transposase
MEVSSRWNIAETTPGEHSSSKGPIKRRLNMGFGLLAAYSTANFHELAGHKESKIVEGHLMGDHVHMCLSIPPKYAVSNVVGYIKGKSAIQPARKFGDRQRNFTGEHFWARGYFVSTVGLDEHIVRAYIRHQKQEDERYDQMKLAIGQAANGGSRSCGRL